MTTGFQPIEIPPGVVATPTKNMSSSNWAEVNLVRWVEGELQPIGGQSKYSYTFASRCKAIHPWYDLSGNYHVAYLCEQHCYVDTGGTLVDITPAGGFPPSPVPSTGGYGDLNYSEDNYGTARASGRIIPITQMPNVWSVDNFGAILLVMNSTDQRLLEWDPASAPGTKLTQTTDSPKGRCFVVTPDRFIIIFGLNPDGTGGGSLRRFGWCNQGDRTNWAFADVASQAGFIDVEPASPIICAESGKFGVIFFTGKKAYVARFLGVPYVYEYSELADDCTPYSPASITATSSYILWMSEQGAFSFDGTSILPIPCVVRAWITNQIDQVNAREQACAVHVHVFNEFWWFFPSRSNPPYNTLCVIYNYRDGWWSQGRMARSAGIVGNYTALPIMANGTVAFQHELGNIYADADNPWAETFDLNLVKGSKLITLKQVIPDIEGDGMENVQFSFYYRNSRSKGSPGQWTSPVNIRSNGFVDARVTGRDIRMRLSYGAVQVHPFTVGQHQVDFAVRGDR